MNYGATWAPRISEHQQDKFQLTRRANAYQSDPESDPCAFVEPKMVPRCPPGVTCAMGGYMPSEAYLQCLAANPKDKKSPLRFVEEMGSTVPWWAWAVGGAALAMLVVRR